MKVLQDLPITSPHFKLLRRQRKLAEHAQPLLACLSDKTILSIQVPPDWMQQLCGITV